jgi:hypothetical protein
MARRIVEARGAVPDLFSGLTTCSCGGGSRRSLRNPQRRCIPIGGGRGGSYHHDDPTSGASSGNDEFNELNHINDEGHPAASVMVRGVADWAKLDR